MQWKPEGLFDSKWANLVGGMIVRHFLQYGKQPNGQMTSIFEDWANKTTSDEKTVESVERFLQHLSDGATEEPSDYILDVAKNYFDKVKVEAEIEAAKQEVEHGRVEDAVNRLQNLNKTNLGSHSYLEPSAGPEPWSLLGNTERRRALVRYGGPLGDFIGEAFQRKTFWSFMAPDKTGKTTWLIDLLYLSIRQRNRVAYFDTGDSDEEEILMRLASRVTGRPEYEETVSLPVSWDGEEPSYDERKLESVDTIEAFRKFRKMCKSDNAFRLSSHPNSTVSANDLDKILVDWSREGWIPDVVIIDYADILAPPKGVRDSLDQIDETWKRLRRISQDRSCLVLTATQSSAANYGNENYLLGKRDFSGRKTKLAHVNGMIGINVSSKEKDLGRARINLIVRRKGRYNEKHYVRVVGSMAIGNPAILSKR